MDLLLLTKPGELKAKILAAREVGKAAGEEVKAPAPQAGPGSRVAGGG